MPKEDPLKLLQRKARESQEMLELLYSIAQDMSFRRAPAFLLNQVMGRVAKVMRVEAASLLLLNAETGLLDFAVVKGLNAQALKELDTHLKPSEGLAGWVFAHNKPALINDPDKDPRFQPGVDWLTGFKTHNLLAAPLCLNERPFGVLELVNRAKKEDFTEEDAELAAAISRLLTTTLDNVRTLTALENAQVLLKTFLEHAGEGFVAVNRQGILTHANAGASELFGWTTVPVGRPMTEAFAAAPELGQAMTQLMAEDKPLIRQRFSFRVAAATSEVEGRVFLIPLPGQAPFGAGAILRRP